MFIVFELTRLKKPENPGERWPDLRVSMSLEDKAGNIVAVAYHRLVTTKLDSPWWSFEAFLDRSVDRFRGSLRTLHGLRIGKRLIRKWLSFLNEKEPMDKVTIGLGEAVSDLTESN